MLIYNYYLLKSNKLHVEYRNIKKFILIFSRSSASASAKQTIFYVEVTDDMQIHPGQFDYEYSFQVV